LGFFPFAFRIVQSRNPTNLPAGRAPEPFRQEDKSERQTFKGHKTFLLRTLAQHKNFYAKATLDRLPMLIVRSTCKRGKIIPLWGTHSLRKSKGKRES